MKAFVVAKEGEYPSHVIMSKDIEDVNEFLKIEYEVVDLVAPTKGYGPKLVISALLPGNPSEWTDFDVYECDVTND